MSAEVGHRADGAAADRGRPRARPRGRATWRALRLAALAAAVPLAPLAAQEAGAPQVGTRVGPDSLELVDRVAAVVGDTVVLLSDVQQEFLRFEAQGAQLPAPGSPEERELARQILDALMERMLMLQQAKRTGLTVSDERVQGLTEELFRERRGLFASEQAFQRAVEASGQNMFQFRQTLQNEARAELLLEEFQRHLRRAGELPPVNVTEDEIRSYFQANAAGQTRPATVSFHRLMVEPVPSAEAMDSAGAKARRALEEVQGGESFEVVARRWSEDPGSRERGGELGWLRRGDVVPAFGDAAWNARPGQTVGPVRTRFGLHLIRVENIRGGERNLRHILIRPELTDAEVERARRLAADFADSLRAGAEVERLALHEAVVDDEELRFPDVPMEQVAEAFGEEIRRALGRPEAGEVLGPIETSARTGASAFVVLRVTEFRAAGQYRLEDVRDTIRERLRTQKQLARYLERLKEETFIRILI